MKWILQIVGVVLLSVLTDVLLPNGQINKFVKGIFAILLVFTVLDPVISLFKGEGVDFPSYMEITEDVDYLASVNEKRADAYEEALKEIFAERDIEVSSVDVTYELGKVTSIEVVLKKDYDVATIKDIICGHINVDELNIVIVYGT